MLGNCSAVSTVGKQARKARFVHLQFVEKCDVFICKVFAPLFSKSGWVLGEAQGLNFLAFI